MGKSARVLRGALVAATALMCVGADTPEMEFGTGLVPVDPATYAKFPKVGRYRAFFGPKADLTDRFPKPGHQGPQGSCSAWSTGYAAASFLLSGGKPASGPAEIVSPAYIYTLTRSDPQCRRGVELSKALDLLKTEGAGTMAQFPYEPKQCPSPPEPAVRASFAGNRIGGWQAVAHKTARGVTTTDWREPIVIDDIKGKLWQGRPVVFGMKLPADFMKLQKFSGVYKSDEVFDRHNFDPTAAMHAMTLVGYDDKLQAFRLINSWGTFWGDGGYLWIDYETFKNLVGEAYVMEPLNASAAAPAPTPPPPPTPSPPTIPVEARLAQGLTAPTCGRLKVTSRAGQRVIQGYGGSATELAALRSKAVAIDPSVEWAMVHRPWPQCEAEMILEKPLADPGPQLKLALDTGAALDGDPLGLREEQLFTIEAETTATRPFLHVVYVQADGSAVELYRGAPKPDARGRRRVIKGAAGTKEERFQVAPPLGDEVVVAIASDRELLGGGLADFATEREFLSALQTAIVRAGEQRRPSPPPSAG
jgi:hypothetical protein